MDPTALNRKAAPRITWAPEPVVDVAALAAELKAAVEGEVRFDQGTRALYATDASNYREVPIGVVIPRHRADVVRAIAVCRRHGVPITARGGGTSLAGQTCNVAVILDFSKYMNQVLALDPEARLARVEPGTILDDLRHAAERHHLTFGPDPATHNRCTLGGMLGNDSCGMHAQMAGRTSQNVLALEVVLYDGTCLTLGHHYDEGEIEAVIARGGREGEIFSRLRALRDTYADRIRARFPQIPRLVSGYGLQFLLPENGFNLAAALVGTEGTCVTILEAHCRLVESPPARTLVVLGYPDVYQAGDHVPEILPFKPLALEGIDDRLIAFMERKELHVEDIGYLPEGKGWLIVEVGGADKQEADAVATRLTEALKAGPNPPTIKVYADAAEEGKLWELRESGLGATAFVPGMRDSWPGWEDSAVPPEQVGAYLRALRALFDRYGYAPSLYGHFGQGCIHCSVDFDLVTAEGIAHWRAFLQEAAELVTSYGGSLSGEHGDGQARAELLPIMFGPELVEAFREFKAIWDPDGRMNPGKVVDANPITGQLRLGTEYHPPALKTHFQFPDDNGSFAHATLRCVGVGLCRRTEGGTMCPSFMVTREEKDTTRGRARTLFEMLNGSVIEGGWRDEAVKDALDLCLACKGCKGECPINVDMATYKAEFLSHHYAGRLRPMPAYTMGLIHWWARLASLAPRLANACTQSPFLSGLIKSAAGLAPERPLPSFAQETFKQWYFRRQRPEKTGKRVILWADTFNNHFHPDVAKAALEVLEAAGLEVVVPRQALCCGRPLYDYGLLGQAKRQLRQILDALAPEIRAGVPIIGLEPSCVSVFRDELLNLFPNDEDAKRLKAQTYLFSEYLIQLAPEFKLPKLERKALVHGHCHHRSVLKFKDEEAVIQQLGLDYTLLDAGCCGLAGSFGFEAGEKYALSVKAGERVLLPAVREADADTLVMTDGFSCRTQIDQLGSRASLHLAEVAKLALEEAGYAPAPTAMRPRGPSALVVAAVVLAGVGLAALAWRGRQP